MNEVTNLKHLKQVFEERLEPLMSKSEVLYHFKCLASHEFEIPFHEVVFRQDAIFDDSKKQKMFDYLARLEKNEPLQHILGYTEFCGLNILTSSAALIPRPETEELVHLVKYRVVSDESIRIIDLCTGTGCIALGLYSLIPNSKITGYDLSMAALSLAVDNAMRLQYQVDFRPGDVLSDSFFIGDGTIDVIVSNPPYIPESDKAQMHENVLNFEPHMALFVENDKALIFYEKIAFLGKRALRNRGHLFFEVHERYGEEVADLLREVGYSDVEIIKDMQEKNRMISARWVE